MVATAAAALASVSADPIPAKSVAVAANASGAATTKDIAGLFRRLSTAKQNATTGAAGLHQYCGERVDPPSEPKSVVPQADRCSGGFVRYIQDKPATVVEV
ncbi:hypothetical protein B586_20065 [Mycobacterium haemophilum DSM 44634]|nr:hypothetical protein B586_20065 [Mycobacterium haemophilum DSM 44634]